MIKVSKLKLVRTVNHSVYTQNVWMPAPTYERDGKNETFA